MTCKLDATLTLNRNEIHSSLTEDTEKNIFSQNYFSPHPMELEPLIWKKGLDDVLKVVFAFKQQQ